MVPPGEAAGSLDWLLFAQAGVLTWQQAVTQLGFAAARHQISSGRWRRLCRGVLVAGTGPLSAEQQTWAAVLAAGPGAVLAGLAAARAAGLRGRWRYAAVDVLVPAGRRAPDLLRRLPVDMPAVRVRRTRCLPPAHVQRGRPTRTTCVRAVVDAARWVRTEEEAQTVVAAACQQRLVTPAELLEVLATLPNVARRALIRETARDAAGGAGALSEIGLSRLCRRYGLPAPHLQQRRVDAAGRVRYLDAYWPGWRLHVEVDGAHHTDAGEWAADMRRQNDVWTAGDRILRFPAWLVRHRPAEVAGQLRTALMAAGWAPG